MPKQILSKKQSIGSLRQTRSRQASNSPSVRNLAENLNSDTVSLSSESQDQPSAVQTVQTSTQESSFDPRMWERWEQDNKKARLKRITIDMNFKQKEEKFKQERAILLQKIALLKKNKGDKKAIQILQNRISAKKNRLRNWEIKEVEIPRQEAQIKVNDQLIKEKEQIISQRCMLTQAQKNEMRKMQKSLRDMKK